MVDAKYVQSQLAKIKFGGGRVNRAEVNELQFVLLDDEKIYECVNGFYEGGVALLVATDIRVLLIDKKPMGFLNVDDMRFDMISDLDYSHRILGARIAINCGMKNLIFKSYNQARLRKLIGHVQQRMSEMKRELNEHASVQKQHLEDINKQLQMYLLAQQQTLEKQLKQKTEVPPIKPSPQLADYLFAQRLLEDFHNNNSPKISDNEVNNNQPRVNIIDKEINSTNTYQDGIVDKSSVANNDQALLDEIVEAGRREVFGKAAKPADLKKASLAHQEQNDIGTIAVNQGVDMTLFRIAYAKLPYLLKTRRYRQPFSAN